MIDREKTIKGLLCIKGNYIPCASCKYANADGYGRGDRCKSQCAGDAIELLKEQPEIVRCKDCRHGAFVAQVGTLPYVTCRGVDHELDWFCADGKRW